MFDSTKGPVLFDEIEILILGDSPVWAFSHLWTKCEILIHYRNEENNFNEQFVKLEWMHKGVMFIHLLHIVRMNDNADAKRILPASPPADWRRQLGRPRITWLSTVQQDLKQHHLTLPEAADLAQNRPLWRMMLTYGATQS